MKNRTLTLTIGFAVLGVFIVFSTIYVYRVLLGTQQQGLPLITVAKNARSEVGQTSLQLHKYLTGDTNVGVEQQVQGVLAASKVQLQAAHDNALVTGNVGRYLNDETRALFQQGIVALDRLAESNKAAIN